MNTFMNALENNFNYKRTENGAVAYKSTMNSVYDMFALGAAYRNRTDEDCILLFKKAFAEDQTLALKCLFYIRDCRGGQGERRFFRVCLRWLANLHPDRIRGLIQYIPFYGRWDDLFELFGTHLEADAIDIIRNQFMIDMECEKHAVSLLAKWAPSENASSAKTIARAKKLRNALGLTSKDYRRMLTKLREKINVLETLMSANRWDEIEFDKIPSRAGIIYKNAFARREIIAKKYEKFAKSNETKVNAQTLYPYEVVNKVFNCDRIAKYDTENVDRLMINKYWQNLPDYLNGADASMLCVIDTSGSMTWSGNSIRPIDVAISLGLYCAERMTGPFANKYISFASRPQLINTDGVDFFDKVRRIYETNLIDDTNLTAVFDLLLYTARKKGVKASDIPHTIVVISDMEINNGATGAWTSDERRLTEMERIRKEWESFGYEMPRIIYWNVNARNDTILDKGPNVTFVSGASPILFKQVLTGKNGWDLCLETITAERYKDIV